MKIACNFHFFNVKKNSADVIAGGDKAARNYNENVSGQ